MAAKKGKEAGTPDVNGFVEEPDFGNAPGANETVAEEEHETQELREGREPNNERIDAFLAENPEFAMKAQSLAETPEELKLEIVKQDIVRERQFEARYNGVWAKLCAEPKLFTYYNGQFKQIADPAERKKAICKEYYESLKIEGNYVNPRFYDKTVTDEQLASHIKKNPEQMKRLDALQAEGRLMMVYARNEYYMTAGERRAKRKVEEFLESHEPDRKQIESWGEDKLMDSVIRDTYFKVSRKEAVNEVVNEWLDRSPGIKARLEKEHEGKDPEHRRNSILKDAAEAYRKATGKTPHGERIEFTEENIMRHVETHPEIYEPIRQMSHDELVAKDVQRRMNGSARAWQANPKISLFNELLKQVNPDLHKQIISNARFQQEPFRTQKIAKSIMTKGQEMLVTNPQVAQRMRGASR